MSDVIAFPSKLERISAKVREIDAGKMDTQIAGVFNMEKEQLQKTALDLWRGMNYSRQHISMLQHTTMLVHEHINVAARTILSSPSRALTALRTAQELCRAIEDAQEEPKK